MSLAKEVEGHFNANEPYLAYQVLKRLLSMPASQVSVKIQATDGPTRSRKPDTLKTLYR